MPTSQLSEFVKAYDVRGLVPEQLDETVARAIGSAFAELVVGEGAGRVVVGHDMRPSSPALSLAFAQGVGSRGAEVVMIDLCSTDELYFASGLLDCPGAMFTASHNPARYNGIKMCRSKARPVGLDSGLTTVRDRAQALLDHPEDQNEQNQPSGDIQDRDVLGDYARFLRGLVDLASSRQLRVVIDAGNGMSGLTAPAVLSTAAGLPELALEIVPLYFELDGSFPNHEANPLDPANLVDLQHAVLEHSADLGLAFDGDADRCFFVDERGHAVDASAVTALIATREIARAVAAGADPAQVSVVYNVISSAAVGQIIAENGARGVRTRVGHSFIKAEMARHDAVFGGEHSAHYYFRDFWFADTGMLAALHLLAALGEQDRPLSELVGEYSRYVASGEVNSTVTDAPAVTERVRRWAGEQGATFDDLDGMTARGRGEPMWWLNVRASNTEPLLRLNVEAADRATMEAVRDTALQLIREQPALTLAEQQGEVR